MHFGIVLPPGALTSPLSGFDYLEADVADVLNPQLADDAWHLPSQTNPPVRAVHSLIPPSLPITGPDVHLPALRLHVQRVGERAAQLGVRIIALSSPAALCIPDGFDPKQAKSQILEFLRTALPFFARYDLMLVAGVNPADQTNVMTSLPEVMAYVWQIDHPCFAALLHVGKVTAGQISIEQVGDALPWIRHVHCQAIHADRVEVFAQLKQGNYADRISVLGDPTHVGAIRQAWDAV